MNTTITRFTAHTPDDNSLVVKATDIKAALKKATELLAPRGYQSFILRDEGGKYVDEVK